MRLPEGRPAGRFIFSDWALAARFVYPERAAPMLARVGSPAEAYFVRRLFETEATIYDGGEVAHCRGVSISVQRACGPYRIDVVAQSNQVKLAIEIDGFLYHNATRGQVAADYFRARRLLCVGYVVVRFTAGEVMANPTKCWQDVFNILKSHTALQRIA